MTKRALLAALLMLGVAGCSTSKTEELNARLKSKGIEVKHGTVQRVFRF